MLKYKLYKDTRSNSPFKGSWYAHVNVNETKDIEGLAAHMAAHNTPFSKGTIKGILTDMVICIHELALNGVAVKLDNLAIFSLGIVSKPAAKPSEFKANSNIEAFKLRARATGQFTKAQLKQVANISEMTTYNVEEDDDETNEL